MSDLATAPVSEVTPTSVPPVPTPERLLRMDSVVLQTGVSKAQLYRLMAAGEFPRPVPLYGSGRSKAWVESEVQSWISSRIAAAIRR